MLKKYRNLIKFFLFVFLVACSNNEIANIENIDYYAKARTEFKDICAEWELPERKDKFPVIASLEDRKICGSRIEAKAEELSLECHKSKSNDPLECDRISELSSLFSEREVNCKLDYYGYKSDIDFQFAELKRKKVERIAMTSIWTSKMFDHLSIMSSICTRFPYGRVSRIPPQDFDKHYQIELAEYQKYFDKLEAYVQQQ